MLPPFFTQIPLQHSKSEKQPALDGEHAGALWMDWIAQTGDVWASEKKSSNDASMVLASVSFKTAKVDTCSSRFLDQRRVRLLQRERLKLSSNDHFDLIWAGKNVNPPSALFLVLNGATEPAIVIGFDFTPAPPGVE